MVSRVHTDSSSLSQKLETWPQGRKAVIGAERLTGGFTGSNGVFPWRATYRNVTEEQ